MPQQPHIGQHFGHDIDERSQAAAHQDDPKPVVVRTAPDKVHDRQNHQNCAVTIVARQVHGVELLSLPGSSKVRLTGGIWLNVTASSPALSRLQPSLQSARRSSGTWSAQFSAGFPPKPPCSPAPWPAAPAGSFALTATNRTRSWRPDRLWSDVSGRREWWLPASPGSLPVPAMFASRRRLSPRTV